jgi:hypothetical protein
MQCYLKLSNHMFFLLKVSTAIFSSNVVFFDGPTIWVQKFTSLLVDVFSNVVQTHLHSYASLPIGAWLLTHPSAPSFCLSCAHFLTAFYIHLDIPHPIIVHLSWCKCGHTINDLGIHLLHCSCGSECIAVHDALWNIITTIASKNGAHVQRKVFHLFLHHTWKWVDIVITINNFRTLANIIIVNSTCIDLVQCVSMTTMHAITIVAQNKAWSYTKRTLGNNFIPLAINL